VGIADRRREYETTGIDIDELDADPITQWQTWYAEAVDAGAYEPNAMVLSTVDGDGLPDARFVLVRGVDERGFAFYTNLRSTKAAQLRASPFGALTFAWLELHRQVRARGRIVIVGTTDADDYWAGRPRGSRVGAWASPQSMVLSDRHELEQLVAGIEARFAGDDVPRPPYWGGYRLEPDAIQFWQGRASRLHDRFRYTPRDGGWQIERLSP